MGVPPGRGQVWLPVLLKWTFKEIVNKSYLPSNGVLTFFVKNGANKTFTLLQNNSRTTRGEKSTQFLTGTTRTVF